MKAAVAQGEPFKVRICARANESGPESRPAFLVTGWLQKGSRLVFLTLELTKMRDPT